MRRMSRFQRSNEISGDISWGDAPGYYIPRRWRFEPAAIFKFVLMSLPLHGHS